MIPPVSVALLSEDRKAFTLTVGRGYAAWSKTYDVRELPGQLQFYRRLRDRRFGQFARFYESTVTALERLQKELRE